MKNEKNISSEVNLSTPITKVLAIGRLTEKGMVRNDRLPVMLKEVPATVRLYLSGKLEQWFVKPDASGVVFMMNVTTAEEAHELLEALPLGLAGMMEFDLIPLGPLTPLRFLLDTEVAA